MDLFYNIITVFLLILAIAADRIAGKFWPGNTLFPLAAYITFGVVLLLHSGAYIMLRVHCRKFKRDMLNTLELSKPKMRDGSIEECPLADMGAFTRQDQDLETLGFMKINERYADDASLNTHGFAYAYLHPDLGFSAMVMQVFQDGKASCDVFTSITARMTGEWMVWVTGRTVDAITISARSPKRLFISRPGLPADQQLQIVREMQESMCRDLHVSPVACTKEMLSEEEATAIDRMRRQLEARDDRMITSEFYLYHEAPTLYDWLGDYAGLTGKTAPPSTLAISTTPQDPRANEKVLEFAPSLQKKLLQLVILTVLFHVIMRL